MCFAPQRRALFQHLNFQNCSESPQFLTHFTLKCALRHNGVHFSNISTSKTAPNPAVFNTFDFEMCFAPQRRALFQHLNFQNCSESPQFLTHFTSKCASRHNGVHFFNISTSKTAPNPAVFNTFYFQMCFAPQRRALFQYLNFQKWSDAEVFCTFSLRNRLRATTACTFSLFISHLPRCLRTRRFSEPTFQPSGATKPRKNTVFRDFPTFSRTCIFFLLIFSLLTLLPADCFFISAYCRKFDFQTSFDDCPYIGNIIIPTVTHSYFSEG